MKGQQRFLSLADFLISIFDLVIPFPVLFDMPDLSFLGPQVSSRRSVHKGEGGIVLTRVAAVGRKSCATV